MWKINHIHYALLSDWKVIKYRVITNVCNEMSYQETLIRICIRQRDKSFVRFAFVNYVRCEFLDRRQRNFWLIIKQIEYTHLSADQICKNKNHNHE